MVAADSKELDAYLKRIYEGTAGIVDKQAWVNSFETILKQVQNGLQIKLGKTDPNSALFSMYSSMQADTARFASFREFALQQNLLALKTDETSFEDFEKEAKKVTNTFGGYLKSEESTAFMRSTSAEKWLGFQENADIYPNLEWRTAGDSDVRPSHQKLEGLIISLSDPLLKTMYPPIGWNDRCDMVQTDEPINKENKQYSGFEKTEVTAGFDDNPGITKKVFSDTAGYYTDASAAESKKLEKIGQEYLDEYLKELQK